MSALAADCVMHPCCGLAPWCRRCMGRCEPLALPADRLAQHRQRRLTLGAMSVVPAARQHQLKKRAVRLTRTADQRPTVRASDAFSGIQPRPHSRGG